MMANTRFGGTREPKSPSDYNPHRQAARREVVAEIDLDDAAEILLARTPEAVERALKRSREKESKSGK